MYTAFWLVAGALAGAWYLRFARRGHAGRERKAYSNGLLIAAAVYLLFAAAAADVAWLGVEALGVLACGALVWLGRNVSFYFVAAGWLLHPLWDVGLHLRGPGRHVAPDWYAIACVSFDVLLAVAIARRVHRWSGQVSVPSPGAPSPGAPSPGAPSPGAGVAGGSLEG